MSRNQKFRASHWTRPIAGVMIAGLVATNSQVAAAQPINPSNAQIRQAEDAAAHATNVLQALVANVTQHERQVSDLELRMGTLRESVNKAMVDLEAARNAADQARAAVDEARNQLHRAHSDLRNAQKQFNELARSIMRQGSSQSTFFEGARDVAEALNRQAAIRREAEKQKKTVDNMDKARTEAANQESSLRDKKAQAESAENTAQQRHTEAESAYTDANQELQKEQEQYQKAQVEREAAKAALEAARGAVNDLNQQRAEYESDKARKEAEDAAAKKAANEAAAKARQEAQTRASESSSDAATDSTQSGAAQSSGTQASSGSSDSSSNSSSAQGSSSSSSSSSSGADTESSEHSTGSAGSTGSTGSSSEENAAEEESSASSSSSAAGTPAQTATPSNPETGQASMGSSSAKIEAVISRAMSQLGVPYAWGGGNANGPTKGIRDGGVADAHGDYNKVGFDCSGLTIYAFAAIGIDLPHYTGYQYQRGTHYPVSQMKRGDLLFWGPNGHGHVAIYLGDGQMIEAPQSGSVVKISPVRYNGMTPNVVRLV